MSKANKQKVDKKKGGFARGVNTLLSGKFLTREYVQTNLSFIFFIVAIMVTYIAYGYYVENYMNDMVAAKSELQELKARNLAVHVKQRTIIAQSTVQENNK